MGVHKHARVDLETEVGLRLHQRLLSKHLARLVEPDGTLSRRALRNCRVATGHQGSGADRKRVSLEGGSS